MRTSKEGGCSETRSLSASKPCWRAGGRARSLGWRGGNSRCCGPLAFAPRSKPIIYATKRERSRPAAGRFAFTVSLLRHWRPRRARKPGCASQRSGAGIDRASARRARADLPRKGSVSAKAGCVALIGGHLPPAGACAPTSPPVRRTPRLDDHPPGMDRSPGGPA